jgi:hypothetical protein
MYPVQWGMHAQHPAWVMQAAAQQQQQQQQQQGFQPGLGASPPMGSMGFAGHAMMGGPAADEGGVGGSPGSHHPLQYTNASHTHLLHNFQQSWHQMYFGQGANSRGESGGFGRWTVRLSAAIDSTVEFSVA